MIYQLLRAVQYLHSEGVVHRDIKPANIIADFSNPGTPTVKLIDFGLAKDFHSAEKMTAMVSRNGTCSYMAPEIYFTESYDKEVDVWSLGCSIFQMLTNKQLVTIPQRENGI